jgi:hypothetical protein
MITVNNRNPDRTVLSDSILVRLAKGLVFEPFENQTNKSGFQMVASLDRFVKKRVMKKIFFITKGSRLEVKNFGPVFKWQKQNGGRPFENWTNRSSFLMFQD